MSRRINALGALTRTFVARFFDNDLTGGSNDLKQSFFWLLSMLIVPGIFIPVMMSMQWAFLARYVGLDALRALSRADKTFYLSVSMIATGIVTSIAWSSLLIDRRDSLVLGPLPVRSATIVRAKLLALAAYMGLLVLAMHALGSVAFGVLLGAENTFAFAVRGVAAHFVASSLASVFVFLGVLAVQGTSLALLGPRGFARVSGLLQLALVTIVVLGLIATPAIVQSTVETLAGKGPRVRPWILSTPPLWFLGVYESLLGTSDRTFAALMRTALVALTAVAGLAALSFPLAYRRAMIDAMEQPDGIGRLGRSAAPARWLTIALGRHGTTRAAAQFFLATIGRVERHRFALALAAGLALAWMLPAVVRFRAPVPLTISGRALGLLAVPLSTLTFLLVGLRIAASLPSHLGAAWIFAATAPDRSRVRAGLRRAMLALGVWPVVIVATPIYWSLWGPTIAIRHGVLCLAAGLLVTECLLMNADGVPCANAWRPERANLRGRWPLYLMAFLLLTGAGSYSLPALELASWSNPFWSAALLGAILLPTALLRWRSSRRPPPLHDDDEESFNMVGVLRLN